eukprot:15465366-Alexandrium_andersonii.AAC.1
MSAVGRVERRATNTASSLWSKAAGPRPMNEQWARMTFPTYESRAVRTASRTTCRLGSWSSTMPAARAWSTAWSSGNGRPP